MLTLRFSLATLRSERQSPMPRYPKKIQISLTQEQHRSLLEVAAKEHKDIEIIVREALERTCLARHQTETARNAATALLKLASQADTPPPEDYQAWEEEYGRVKWAGHGG